MAYDRRVTSEPDRTLNTTRLTIRLPTELLEEVDQTLDRTKNRSALVRRLLEDALRAAKQQHDRSAKEQRDIEAYIRSYTEQPQTEEELGWMDTLSVEALREVPWNESR